jgi:hypothetical protein
MLSTMNDSEWRINLLAKERISKLLNNSVKETVFNACH